MKIRSLILGSAAIAGLATTGYAADLGVVTSLDVCDELGLSGLTISSDDNCLVITGNVKFEYNLGNYKGFLGDHTYATFANANNGNTYSVVDDIGFLDSNRGDVDAWLKFVGTANSDFGPASATIKLISENITGTVDQTVGIDEAWVGIGDTTMLMAGYKSSIFNKGDDVPLNYLGLFNSSSVNTGVLWSKALGNGAKTGGDVIQVVSNLGNGVSIGGGLEGLGQANVTAVGVLAYAGDGVTAHASGAIDIFANWKVHAGFTGAWDPIKVVGAIAADSTGYFNALGSVAATFDMFTLAASAEAASDGWGVGSSISATVTDGVTLNLGGRYWNKTGVGNDVYQLEAAVSALVTETVTLTGAIGVTDGDDVSVPYNPDPLAFYGKAGVAWAPGGGFTAGSSVTVSSLGGYKWVFTSAKSIK
jgi:hypothetical protein